LETRRYFDLIGNGDLQELRELLERRPDLLEADAAPSYAPRSGVRCYGLHAAVHARRLEVARLLLDLGADPEVRTTEGRTALHDSIEFGVPEITKLLIERGAAVDICSAAILGRLDTLKGLLDRDSSSLDDRSTGLSPLGWAAYGNRVDTAAELIRRGARPNDGELLCAASVGHVEVGQFLIEHGADLNGLGEFGHNALHAAAGMRYTHDSSRFVEMLLGRGADVGIQAKDGRTALEIAKAVEREQEKAAAHNPDEERKKAAAVIALLEAAAR
jgi:ankyrin repeat protein